MSQLVIQYNVKFVKGIYFGELLCKVMYINVRRIIAISYKRNPVRLRIYIFKNLKLFPET